MTDKKTTGKKTPEMIEDSKLDDATGGISLLVPAVQKVRDAASRTSTTKATPQLDANSKLADGSV